MTGKRKFDLEKGLADIRAALEKLRQTPPPKVERKASKSEALQMIKPEIAQLYKDGYTLEMIADALSNGDQYGILPSAIKTLLKTPRGTKKVTQKRVAIVAKESKTMIANIPPEPNHQAKNVGKQFIDFVIRPLRNLSVQWRRRNLRKQIMAIKKKGGGE